MPPSVVVFYSMQRLPSPLKHFCCLFLTGSSSARNAVGNDLRNLRASFFLSHAALLMFNFLSRLGKNKNYKARDGVCLAFRLILRFMRVRRVARFKSVRRPWLACLVESRFSAVLYCLNFDATGSHKFHFLPLKILKTMMVEVSKSLA